MAEIKSTLELALERTKGLTMNKEEKHEFKRREMEKKISGLLQKYLDGFLDDERLRAGMQALGEGEYEQAKAMLLSKSLALLSMEGDNRMPLQLLQGFSGLSTEAIQHEVEVSAKALEDHEKAFETAILNRLARQGVSGSAVVPNLDGDGEWRAFRSRAVDELRHRIRQLVTERLSPQP